MLTFFLFYVMEIEGNISILNVNISTRFLTGKGFFCEAGTGFLFNLLKDTSNQSYKDTYFVFYLKTGKRFYEDEFIKPGIGIKGVWMYSNYFYGEEDSFSSYMVIPYFSLFIVPFHRRETDLKNFGIQLSLENVVVFQNSGDYNVIIPIPSIGIYFQGR